MLKKFILPLFLLTAGSAFASFNFTLTNPIQITPPGGIADVTCQSGSVMCLIFQGTIDSDIDLDITGYVVTFTSPADPSPYLTDNPNYFNSLGPAFVIGGLQYSGGIFEIDVDPVVNGDPFTPPGVYLGNVQLIGGPSGSGNYALLGTPQDFEIDVTSAPEPAAWGLMLLGLAAIAFARKRIAV